MTSVQDRLTAATLAAAQTVPDDYLPPLRLPRRRFAVPLQGPRRTAMAVLTPLAAAAAVAAVAVAW